MSDLIDTTEMYLRTIYELQEEGITPMRARIAERLGQSGPTVSQTVARMERDGLVTVDQDRHLELTGTGEQQAVRVMRKHRLAECMLVEILARAVHSAVLAPLRLPISSERAFRSSTSTRSQPAPSAMPRISSRRSGA